MLKQMKTTLIVGLREVDSPLLLGGPAGKGQFPTFALPTRCEVVTAQTAELLLRKGCCVAGLQHVPLQGGCMSGAEIEIYKQRIIRCD